MEDLVTLPPVIPFPDWLSLERSLPRLIRPFPLGQHSGTERLPFGSLISHFSFLILHFGAGPNLLVVTVPQFYAHSYACRVSVCLTISNTIMFLTLPLPKQSLVTLGPRYPLSRMPSFDKSIGIWESKTYNVMTTSNVKWTIIAGSLWM